MKSEKFFSRKKAGRKPLPPEQRKETVWFCVHHAEADKLRAYADKLEKARQKRLKSSAR